jgi:hypothetical protein
MRKAIAIAVVVAGGCAVWALAQDRARDRTSSGPANQRRPASLPDLAPGGASELEWFLIRPGRVVVRDAWDVGRVECRPFDGGGEVEGVVRVTAVVAHQEGREGEKVGGVELVLSGGPEDRTFFFDAGQMPDLLGALHSVTDAADKLRDPPQGARRRIVFTINGLEIGMQLRRTGGYLASVDPDDLSLGLSPDDFERVLRLLEDARDVLNREVRRPGAADTGTTVEPGDRDPDADRDGDEDK